MASSRSPENRPLAGLSAAELVAEAATNRPALKRVAAAIDTGDPSIKSDIVDHARSIGIDLPADAETWPAKRILRRAMGREAVARQRSNPIARDEPFQCWHCRSDVAPGGSRVRDHCPHCLRSLHVDVVPGDRAAECGGDMHPIGLNRSHGDDTIVYQCVRCGTTHQVVVHADDSQRALRAIINLPPM